jgi:hypothetical protein
MDILLPIINIFKEAILQLTTSDQIALTVAIGASIVSIITWVIGFNARFGGPTRREYQEFTDSFHLHVKKEEESIREIMKSIEELKVNVAVINERTELIKQLIDGSSSLHPKEKNNSTEQ